MSDIGIFISLRFTQSTGYKRFFIFIFAITPSSTVHSLYQETWMFCFNLFNCGVLTMPYTNFLSVIFLINLFLLQGCSSSQHYKRASQAECRPRQTNIKTIPISEKTNKNTAIPSITPRIKAKIIKKEPQKINKPPSSKRKTSIKKECKKKMYYS